MQCRNTTASASEEEYEGLQVCFFLLFSDTVSVLSRFSSLKYGWNLVKILKMSVLNKEVTLMAGNKPRGSVARHRDGLSVCCAAVQTPVAAGRGESTLPQSLRKPVFPWSSASLRHLIWIQSRQPVFSLQTPAAQETDCCWPFCPHKCNADPSQPAASLLPQLNDTLSFYYSSQSSYCWCMRVLVLQGFCSFLYIFCLYNRRSSVTVAQLCGERMNHGRIFYTKHEVHLNCEKILCWFSIALL